MKTTGKVTSRDGTVIAFDRTGTGLAVILVDAAGGFRGLGPMGRLAELLAVDFTAITYDRRGRGESGDTEPYTVEREVDDLEALIDASGGSAFVYGFSSGAVLALHAAAAGLPIRKLALLEPPLELDPEAEPDTMLEKEVAALVAAGRRGDAVEHFHASIGVPVEITAEMRDAAYWPLLESSAHTLVYDCIVTRTFPAVRLATIATPTLVIDSQDSDARLHGWARGVAEALPNGKHRSMKGEWHGVPPQDLAPVLAEFFLTVG